jgi:P pilus assembly chaperone PapD
MRNGYRWFVSAFLLLLAAPAHAQFVMSEMIIDFPDNTPRAHDVELISRSPDTQYIATETYVIEHPSQPNEKRILFKNPIKSGLLVTPNKMVLPSQSRKLMRFLVIAPQTDRDQIYRVVVKPVIQGVDENKKRVALKVLVGYDALVIVRPKGAKIDLSGERKGNALTLTNKGNTNASVQAAQQCDALGNNCKDINVSRIYAGQSTTVTLPYLNGEAKLRVWDGSNTADMKF